MIQINYNTKRKTFKHLNIEKRKIIEQLLEKNVPKKKIAELLNISRSTLYNEIKRGTVMQRRSDLTEYEKYFADVAQSVYEKNRKNCKRPLKLTEVIEFIEYAEEQILKNKLSPDAICGRAKVKKVFKKIVCTKTLYNYIALGILKVKNIDLPLRVKVKTKHRRLRKNRRILGESIENRPAVINNREEFGHWEIDTVIGTKSKGSVLLTLDERLTRKRIILKISEKTATAVKEGITKIFDKFGEHTSAIFKSITSDNGSEFSDLTQTLPTVKIYYAHPYSSGERGTNEKQNSLIRNFHPKGKSFDDVSETAIKRIEDWINNLPRKFAQYLTPNELFDRELKNLNIIF